MSELELVETDDLVRELDQRCEHAVVIMQKRAKVGDERVLSILYTVEEAEASRVCRLAADRIDADAEVD